MITHEKIWRALDRVAREHGLSGGGLARAAELDQTIFNPSKRCVKATGRARWPSSETIAKVLNVTGLSMSQFGAMVDGVGDGAGDGASRPAAATPGVAAGLRKQIGPARGSGAKIESKLSEK